MNDHQLEGILTPALDDDEPDQDGLATFQDNGFRRLEQVALLEAAFTGEVERAKSSQELLATAKLFAPEIISDRLEEVFSPPDREEEDGGSQPELLLGSLKEFLYFCLRMRGLLDDRFLPGRTHEGELGIQFLDDRLGDLSVRFRSDGSVLVAIISDGGVSTGSYLARMLCTPLDHFNITRWM